MVSLLPIKPSSMAYVNPTIAPAQGLMAQVRVLGGSIGIAASSAILSVKLQEISSGPPRPGEPPFLGSGDSALFQGELAAARQAYADAFNEDMKTYKSKLAQYTKERAEYVYTVALSALR